MKDSFPQADQLLDVVRSVSPDVHREAGELFEEDTESLRTYLRSDAFWQDLLSHTSPVQMDADVFFYLLFERFRRKLDRDEEFREAFARTLRESSDQNWDLQRTSRFLNDRDLILYLVQMLNHFVRTDRLYQLPTEKGENARYIVDMIQSSVDSDKHESFQIFCHIGNYTLYLTGVFPDWIRHRHRYKNRPMNLDSYRTYGQTYYERAASHSMADRRQLRSVLTKLAEGFDPVRSMISVVFRRLVPAFE